MMANPVLQMIITAKDSASSVVSSLKGQIIALGVAIGAAFTIKGVMDFEVALDKLAARSSATGPELDNLIERAKNLSQTLGPEFGYSAEQAVNGLTDLVAAGFSTEDAMSALKGVLSLAAMEGIDVSQAAVMMSDAISQYGLSAKDATAVSDILAKSAGLVAATATDMAEALKYCGTSASGAGMSLTETTATLDVLAKAGIRGSEGGTALASVLGILSNPAHAATQALFEMGATSTELSDVLDFLNTRGVSAAGAIGLFGEQGGRAINTLLMQGGSKTIDGFAKSIESAGRSAEETAKIMQDNLSGAFSKFWEQLKVVGVELKSDNLAPMTAAVELLTAKLKEYASSDSINAFQAELSKGLAQAKANFESFANGIDWEGLKRQLNDVWASFSVFTSTIDWDGLYQSAGNAFNQIRISVESVFYSVQSLISSFSGQYPDAVSVAQKSSELLQSAWSALKEGADYVSGAVEKVALSLSDDTPASVAQRALAAVRAELNDAEIAYNALLKTQKIGQATQEQVSAAWGRLQKAVQDATTDVSAAEIAYQSVVTAQKAGNATQEQVGAAWNSFQTVIASTNTRVNTAQLAHDALSASLKTGESVVNAVKTAHEQLTVAQGQTESATNAVKQATDEQVSGFSMLYSAMESVIQSELKSVLDNLTNTISALLNVARDLVDNGLTYVSGALTTLKPSFTLVSDVVSVLADAVVNLLGVFKPSMEGMKASGELMGSAVSAILNTLVTGFSVVSAAALKLTEVFLTVSLEAGKLFGVISDQDAAELEKRISKVGDSASGMFDIAIKSSNGFISSLQGMGAAIDGTTPAIEKTTKTGLDFQKQYEITKQTTDNLTVAIKNQEGVVLALTKADIDSIEGQKEKAAAIQRLWELQDQLSKSQSTLIGLQTDEKSIIKEGGVELLAYVDALSITTPAQKTLSDTLLDTTTAAGLATNEMVLAQPALNQLTEAVTLAEQNLQKANTALTLAEEGTFGYAMALTGQENAHAAVKAAQDAYNTALTTSNSSVQSATVATQTQTIEISDLIAKMDGARIAYEKQTALQKTGVKDQEALNTASTAYKNAIQAVNTAIDIKIAALEKEEGLTTKAVTAQQRQNVEIEKQIQLDISRANSAGNYNAVAESTIQLGITQGNNAVDLAEKLNSEALAAQNTANSYQLKYDTLLKSDPLNKTAIADALKSAETSQTEANTKLDAARAADTHAASLKNEQTSTAGFRQALEASIATIQSANSAEMALVDSKVAVAKSAYDLAVAQKDEGAQSAALTALKAAEIERAQQVVVIKQQEADAARTVAAAKIEEAKADGLVTAAETEMIANAKAVVAAKEGEIQAAQNAVDAAKANAVATKDNTAATKDNTAVNQSHITSLGDVIDSTVQLTAKGKEWLQTIREEQTAAGSLVGNMVAYANALSTIWQRSQGVIESEKVLASEVERLTSVYERGGQAGERARLKLLDMATSGQAGMNALTTAGEAALQKLDQIRQAALSAEQSLSEMSQDFTKQILQIQGDQKALLDIEQKERLAQLEAYYQQAGTLGQAEYQDAINKANQLYQLKLAQLADADNAESASSDKAAKVAVDNANAISGAWKEVSDTIAVVNNSVGGLAKMDMSALINQSNELKQNLLTVQGLL